MYLFALLLLIATTSAASNQLISTSLLLSNDLWWEECRGANDQYTMRPQSVTITPQVPIAGQEVEVRILAKVTKRIEPGSMAKVQLKLGLIKLLGKDFDLCDTLLHVKADRQCPIEPGDLDLTVRQVIPTSAPAVPISGTVTVTNQDGTTITCFNLNFTVQKS